MAVSLRPPGPETPGPMQWVLRSFYDALLGLLQPVEPTPVLALASAALPPAARHPNTLVLVSDLNILAHSDGIHWIRQDTGAVIV